MFIAIEGIGGTGKTTMKAQVGGLFFALVPEIPLVQTREPGGTGCAEHLRTLLREGFPCGDKLDPMGVALLFNTARADLMAKVVNPALSEGKLVLTDRFCDTTFAYQSVVDGIPLDKLIALHEAAIGVYPDMTFILDAPAEVANARVSAEEKATDRFDREGLEKQEAMRQVYLKLARDNPKRYVVVDATKDVRGVYAEMYPHLMGLVQKLTKPVKGQCKGGCPDCIKKPLEGFKVWEATEIYEPRLNQPVLTLTGKLHQ